MLHASNISAYIMSGGKSRRFGQDKARVVLQQQPQILRLRSLLQAIGHPVHVVASSSDQYRDLELHCVADREPDLGPVSGLEAALSHCVAQRTGDWCLLVACDQLVWQPEWTQHLVAAVASTHVSNPAAEDRTDLEREAEIVVFTQQGQSRASPWQPLPGLFHRSLLDVVRRQLTEGRGSLQSLLSRSATKSLAVSELPSIWAFNTQQELDARIAELGWESD